MRVWYHPLINDTIVTMNPRYNILLNEVFWYVMCWRRVHPLSDEPFESSSFQVATLSDEHSLLKKFSEFQKRGKERQPQPLIFRKTQPFEIPPTKFVPTGKFIGRTFAFKKFFGVSKEG